MRDVRAPRFGIVAEEIIAVTAGRLQSRARIPRSATVQLHPDHARTEADEHTIRNMDFPDMAEFPPSFLVAFGYVSRFTNAIMKGNCHAEAREHLA